MGEHPLADRRINLRGQLQNREYIPRCKNDGEREVVLYSGLAGRLGARRQAEGYVFLDPKGRPWSNEGPGRAFLSRATDRLAYAPASPCGASSATPTRASSPPGGFAATWWSN
jgi:hypothetical protein